MMQLSPEGALGLYVLHSLAAQDAAVSTRVIARSAKVAVPSVARTLRRLRRAGLVRAVRGRGYLLARPPGEIRILDVLDAVNGGSSAEGCRARYDTCVFRGSCPFMPLCRETYETERAALRSQSVADLLPREPAMPDCLGRRRRAAF